MRWILFDVGGVLEIVDDGNWQFGWVERSASLVGIDLDGFGARIRSAPLPRIDIESGRAEEYWAGIGRAVGATADVLRQLRADFWDSYCGRPNAELIEYARSLRDRAGTAILSNSADGAREEEEARFGFSEVFDPICYSHELGVLKPDPRAYEVALERMGADAADVLFLDDHAPAVEGALECGMSAARFVGNAAAIAAIEEFLDRP